MKMLRARTISSFKGYSALKLHIRSVHLKVFIYNCDFCEAAFPVKGNLLNHIRVVHSKVKSQLKCGKCRDKPFLSKWTLIPHIRRVHDKAQGHKCTECNKTYTSKGNLNKHVSVAHTETRPFSCDVCNAAFTHKSHLQSHTEVHANEK